MSDEEEYSYFEIDPANIPKSQENAIETDSRELFKTLNELPLPLGIVDLSKGITKLYSELPSKKPSSTPTPPPPVPTKDVSSPPPTETLPALPAAEDSPQQQGAPDVEAKIIVDIRPSEGQVRPQRAPNTIGV